MLVLCRKIDNNFDTCVVFLKSLVSLICSKNCFTHCQSDFYEVREHPCHSEFPGTLERERSVATWGYPGARFRAAVGSGHRDRSRRRPGD